jgi:hypothetical protein
MSPSGPNLDDLIRAQRQGVGMSDKQRAANRTRVLSRVLAGGAVGTTVAAKVAAALPAKASGVFAGSWVVRIAVAMALAGAAGGVYVGTRSPPNLAQPHLGAPRAPVARQPAAVEPAAEQPVTPKLASSGSAAPASASSERAQPLRHPPLAASVTPPSLAAEVQLMHDVEAALRANQPQRALALLDQHRGDGFMAEERAAAHVVTLCQLGRSDAARKEAADFLRARPRSPLAARMRSTCAKPIEAAPDRSR